MKLLSLRIDGFGRFHDFRLDFKEGLNVIYGRNEAGKSTIHSFIRAMLYGAEKKEGALAAKSLYGRFLPWDKPEVFGGELRFLYQGKKYRLTRKFSAEHPEIHLRNETDSIFLEDPEAFLNTVRNGLSESAYCNSVSIGQLKSQTGREMIRDLKDYISSVNTTGNASFNADRALALLKEERNRLDLRILRDAPRQYASVMGEIRNLEREISAPEYTNESRKYSDLLNRKKEELKDSETEREEITERISEAGSALRSAGFTGKAAIMGADEAFRNSYNHYAWLRICLKRKGKLILSVLSILASIFCLILMIFGRASFTMQARSSLLQNGGAAVSGKVFLLLLIGTILFWTLGIVGFASRIRMSARFQKLEGELEETLKAQLGYESISEESAEACHTRFEELARLSDSLDKDQADLKKLNDRLSSLTEEERRAESELKRQNELQNELDGKLEHLANLQNRAELLKHTIEENDRLAADEDAIDLASETLTRLSSSIRESFGTYLNRESGRLISAVTNAAYKAVWVDDNLGISMITENRTVPLEAVSSGTMDQIYLAVRIAVALFLQRSAPELMPLVFDDSFVLYDSERLEKALLFLKDAYPAQILLFTCHQREDQILTEAEIPHSRSCIK